MPALVGAGHRVRATSRGPADALEPQSWLQPLDGIDAVVHLAGVAHRKATADEHQVSNHLATAALAKACKLAAIKQLIFISSIASQTGPSSDRVIRETDHASPATAYGQSKLDAERAIRALDVPSTILRPVAVYGPGAKGNFRTLKKIADLPLPLPLASLNAPRSVLSSDNFNTAVLSTLSNSAAIGETFIVANQRAKTVQEMVADLRGGRSAGMFPLPNGLLEPVMRCARIWDKIGRPLVVDASKLSKLGWNPVEGPVTA